MNNLQRFTGSTPATPVKGNKLLYLIRILKDKATKPAKIIAFQSEGSTSISKDADTTVTKDGVIRNPGAAEIEISISALLSKGTSDFKDLKKAMLDDEVIEVWEVNMDVKGTATDTDKYEATYYQGYLTNLEKTGSAEDYVEVSITIGVNGKGADGYATVSHEQQEAANYVFADTVTGA